jgi:hypothetical protein
MMERMPCSTCGYVTDCEWHDHPLIEEPFAVCGLCRGVDLAGVFVDLPSSQHEATRALMRLANAMADAHGVAYREALLAALLGSGPASGTYEAMD